MRQSKTSIVLTNVSLAKIVRNRVFDGHLSLDWRQMTIENTVSVDFWSAFIDCEERFRLPPTRCKVGSSSRVFCKYQQIPVFNSFLSEISWNSIISSSVFGLYMSPLVLTTYFGTKSSIIKSCLPVEFLISTCRTMIVKTSTTIKPNLTRRPSISPAMVSPGLKNFDETHEFRKRW